MVKPPTFGLRTIDVYLTSFWISVSRQPVVHLTSLGNEGH
jgi:hypothetical protein